jgi:hypothetical protein
MKRHTLMLTCLLAGTTALAAAPSHQPQPRPAPCQGQAPQRSAWPNGTLLWGTTRQVAESETSSVLSSLDLGRVQRDGKVLQGVRIEGGRLVAPPHAREQLAGAVIQGSASDGQPVEVALCGVEPAAEDPEMARYRIEIWNARSATWENPCVATARVPTPRVLAVQGVWDERGARHEVPGRFTFACENGAIAKCIDWGYKPWAEKNGRSLAELHQACTRMARADYCGDGRSHTREDSPIDMYDGLEVLTRTTEATTGWDPEQASFEAAWGPEGALCLARTRGEQAVETILAQCPDRFEAGAEDLGEGDLCTVRRKGASAGAALLRNRAYVRGEQALSQAVTP